MKLRKQFSNLKKGAKKVFIGMLVLCLISTATGIGSLFAYATECENHYAESYTCYDENTHIGTCVNCGKEIEAGHSFNSEGVCVACGYAPESPNDNDADDSGSGDGGSGDGSGEGSAYGKWQKNDATTHIHYNAAGESETQEHQFTDWVSNGNGVMARVCTVCGYMEEQADTTGGDTHTHTYTYTDNGDGTHTAVCSECNELLVDHEAHFLSERWTTDYRGHHVKSCAKCSYFEQEDCNFEDGVCTVCGVNENEIVNPADMIAPSMVKMARGFALRSPAPTTDGFDESDYDGEYKYSDFYTALPTLKTNLTYTGEAQDIFQTTGTLKDSTTLRDDMYVTATTFVPIDADAEGRKVVDAGQHTYEHTINYVYTNASGQEQNAYATGKFTVTVAKASFNSVVFSPTTTNYVELRDSFPFYRLNLGNRQLQLDVDYSYVINGSNLSNPPEIGESVTLEFGPFITSENFESGTVPKTISVANVAIKFNGNDPIQNYNGPITVTGPSGYTFSNTVDGEYSSSFTYNKLGDSTLDVYCKYTATDKIVHKAFNVNISREYIFDDFITSPPEFYEEVSYTGNPVVLCSKDPVFNSDIVDDTSKVTDFSYHYVPVGGGTALADRTKPSETNAGKYGYNLVLTYKNSAGQDKEETGTVTYYSTIYKPISSSDLTFTTATDYQSLDPSQAPMIADAFLVKDGTRTLQRNVNYTVEVLEPSEAPYETGQSLTYTFTGVNNGTTSFYTGTTTKTLPISVIDVKLNGAAQVAKYDDEVEFTAEGYTISDTSGGQFRSVFTYSEPCTDKSLTLYFSKTGTSKVVKQTITHLNIGNAAAITVLYDGEADLKPFYYDSVRISADGYKVKRNAGDSFSGTYILDYQDGVPMQPVNDFTLTFKDNTTGIEYKKSISGINLYKTSPIEVKYNGEELKDWYNDNVSLTASGYTISDKEDSGFAATYKMVGTGNVVKDLYFKDTSTGAVIDADTTKSGIQPYRYVVAIDKTAPTGSIYLGSYSSDAFTTKDSVKAYTNKSQNGSITGSDELSGVDYIHYYVSDTFYSSSSDLIAAISEKSAAWRNYSSGNQPTLTKDKNNYLYAQIADKAGNKTYISLGSILFDTVAPKMTTAKVTPSTTDTSKTLIGLAGTDKLSGINRFKYMYIEKEEGRNYSTPSKEYMFDSGEYVSVSDEKDGTAVARATIDALESSKTYLFYFVAVDRAGNISDVMTQEVKGEAASSKKDSSSGGSGGSGSGTKGLTPSPNGIAGGGSSSGKQGGGSGSSKSSKDKKSQSALGDKDREINRNPYIAEATGNVKIGINETSGWNKIASEVNKADKGAVVEVEMAGLSNVSNELFTSMNNRDVQVKLRMAEDVEWEIKGEEVPNARSDIDMGVRLGSRNIPEQILTDVAGTNPHVEFSINHNGDFGFVATIAVPVGESNKGMYTTLYHYDETKKELEVAGDGRVDDRGYAKFPLTHASDYTVVITPERILTAADTDAQTSTLVAAQAESQSSQYLDGARLRLTDLFRIKGSMRIWLFFVALLSAAVCMVILYLPALQSRNQNDQGDLF